MLPETLLHKFSGCYERSTLVCGYELGSLSLKVLFKIVYICCNFYFLIKCMCEKLLNSSSDLICSMFVYGVKCIAVVKLMQHSGFQVHLLTSCFSRLSKLSFQSSAKFKTKIQILKLFAQGLFFSQLLYFITNKSPDNTVLDLDKINFYIVIIFSLRIFYCNCE